MTQSKVTALMFTQRHCRTCRSVHYRLVYAYTVCVWSVITGRRPRMLTLTCSGDWPREINKQASERLSPHVPRSERLLPKIRHAECSNPNRNTCSSPSHHGRQLQCVQTVYCKAGGKYLTDAARLLEGQRRRGARTPEDTGGRCIITMGED